MRQIYEKSSKLTQKAAIYFSYSRFAASQLMRAVLRTSPQR